MNKNTLYCFVSTVTHQSYDENSNDRRRVDLMHIMMKRCFTMTILWDFQIQMNRNLGHNMLATTIVEEKLYNVYL